MAGEDILIRALGEDDVSAMLKEIALNIIAIADASDTMSAATTAASDLVSGAFDGASQAVAVASQAFADAAQQAINFAVAEGSLADATDRQAVVNQALDDSFAALEAALGTAGDAVSTVSDAADKGSVTFKALGVALNSLTGSIDGTGSMVLDLGNLLLRLEATGHLTQGTFTALADTLDSSFATAADLSRANVIALAAALGPLIQGAVDSARANIAALGTTFATLTASLKDNTTLEALFRTALMETSPSLAAAKAQIAELSATMDLLAQAIRSSANPALANFDTQQTLVAASIAATNRQFAAQTGVNQQLARQLVDVSAKVQTLTGEMQAARDATGALTQAQVDWAMRLVAAGQAELVTGNDLTSVEANQARVLRDLAAATAQVNAEYKVQLQYNSWLGTAIRDEADAEVLAIQKAYELAGADRDLAAAMALLREQALLGEGAISNVGRTMGSTEGQVTGLRAELAGMADSFGSMWMGPLGLAAVGVYQFGKHALTAGADFQKAMTLVTSLAANSKDNIAGLNDELYKMAPAVGQTPTDLANALYYVMSASFHGTDALNILRLSAEAASGGLGSVTDVAKGVTTMLYDFGDTGAGAVKDTDLLIAAVINGKTTIDDFAASLGKTVPFAADYKYSLHDVAGGMDVLTRSGLTAANSATYLRYLFSRIGAQFPAMQTAAAAYNVTLDATTMATIKAKNPNDALIKQLQYVAGQVDIATRAHFGLSKGAQITGEALDYENGILSKVYGGIRSGTGAIALSAQDFHALQTALTATADPAKALHDHFLQVQQTISFAGMKVKASFAVMFDQFVVQYSPQIISLLNKLSTGIQNFSAFMQTHGALVMKVLLGIGGVLGGTLAASLGVGALNMLGFSSIIKGASPLFTVFGNAIGHLGVPMSDLGSHVRLIGVHSTGLVGVFARTADAGAKFGGTIGHLGGAFNPILPAFDAFFTKTAGLERSFAGPGEALKALGKVISGGVMGAIRGLGSVFVSLGAAIWSGIAALPALIGALLPVIGVALLIAGVIAVIILAFIKFRPEVMAVAMVFRAALAPALLFIIGAFKGAVAQIVAAWQKLWPQIQPAMEQLFRALITLYPAIKMIGIVIGAVVAVILAVLVGLANGFIHALPMIIMVFTGIVNVIAAVTGIIFAIFTGKWSQIGPLIGQLFKGIGQIIGGALSAVFQFIVSFVGGVIHFFQFLFDKLLGHSIVPDLVTGIIRWITMLPVQVMAAIIRMVTSVLSEFIHLEVVVIQAISTMVNLAISAVVNMANSIVNAVVSFVLRVLAEAVHLEVEFFAYINLMVRLAINEFNMLVNMVVSAVAGLVSRLLGFADNLSGGFLSKIGSLIGQVVSTFASLPGKIISGLSTLGSQMATVAGNAIDSMISMITNSVGRLASAAGNAAMSIVNGAKHALGIASPSTVMAEIGGHTVTGFVQGITAGKGTITQAGHDTFGAIAGAAAGVRLPSLGGALGAPSGLPLSRALGAGGGSGSVTINVNLQGGLGAGLALLNPTDRRRLAQEIGRELSQSTALQGILPIGYSGRGTI